MQIRHLLLLSALVVPTAAQRLDPSFAPGAPRGTVDARATGLLRLRFATFDPLVGLPTMPAELQSSASEGLQVVQFLRSPTDEDRQAVKALGGEIVGYLPDNAYIVRIDTSKLADLGERAAVRWSGAYQPAFRVEPFLVDRRIYASAQPRRYHVMVANKRNDKPALRTALEAIGGRVDDMHEGSLRMDVTLTGPQLLQAIRLDQVLWIDRWSAPELDMDNARVQGGGNYIEAQAGYTGTGLNVHVYEGIEATHPDFTGNALDVLSGGAATNHGHATAGIVWGNGTSSAAVRGMAPDVGKFYTDYNTVSTSRYQVFDELVNVRDVSLSTASWGNARTFFYTTISAASDDAVFDHDLAWTQSQSNAGNQDSRPQAWAKNVISVGGVSHGDNALPGDDSWAAGNASIGPASDGRIKPTLCAYYDDIGTSDRTGVAGYGPGDWDCCFGGTSGATPIVAGHSAITIEMFTDDSASPGVGRFGNPLRVPGGTTHQNRPHFTTLKGLQVVTAEQYAFSAASTDNRREHQGWGFPSLRNMWDLRNKTFIVDETDQLQQGQMRAYQVTVSSGEPSLKICLNWNEPAAVPSAAQMLVNNLSLLVTAPNGTQYWGNNGLESGVVSLPGGSEDSVNSIENVFIDQPMAGVWFVQVLATQVVADNHVETVAVDVDYSLVAVGGDGQITPPGVFGNVESIGFGCDGTSCTSAIYEYPNFGLANSSMTLSLVNGDYTMVPGQGTWVPPAGTTLAMGDNTELVRNVGFSLPYPGGSTSTLRVCANGWISDGQFNGSSTIVPTPTDFLQNRMWAVLWRDLNPGASGSVWYDSSPSRLVITWLSVPNFFNNGSSTFQVQFWNNGDVHYIYQNVNVQGDYLVGYNGGGVTDPGSIDLAASLGSGVTICANPLPEMSLATSGRPIVGTTFDLVTNDSPVTSIFGLMILSTSGFPQPISLTTLGMPGCELYQPLDISILWPPTGGTPALVPWPLPNDPSLGGFEAYAQSTAVAPGVNAFGFAISNGLKLTVGLN